MDNRPIDDKLDATRWRWLQEQLENAPALMVVGSTPDGRPAVLSMQISGGRLADIVDEAALYQLAEPG